MKKLFGAAAIALFIAGCTAASPIDTAHAASPYSFLWMDNLLSHLFIPSIPEESCMYPQESCSNIIPAN